MCPPTGSPLKSKLMSMYLPKRLELWLRLVRALPKASSTQVDFSSTSFTLWTEALGAQCKDPHIENNHSDSGWARKLSWLRSEWSTVFRVSPALCAVTVSFLLRTGSTGSALVQLVCVTHVVRAALSPGQVLGQCHVLFLVATPRSHLFCSRVPGPIALAAGL